MLEVHGPREGQGGINIGDAAVVPPQLSRILEIKATTLGTIHTDRKYSDRELVEIYDNLNRYIWDDRLGDVPAGWRESDASKGKHLIVQPIMREIDEHISWYAFMRQAHVVREGQDVHEFLDWYLNDLDKTVRGLLNAVVSLQFAVDSLRGNSDGDVSNETDN